MAAAKPASGGGADGCDAHDDWAPPPGWRWGLWSPSDKKWHDALIRLWEGVSAADPACAPTAAAIPKKIHQIWLGQGSIPEFCQRMMATWRAHHPSWEYRLWTDADIAEAALPPRLSEIFSAASSPAERSDVLRLWLVLQHGGFYADVDFECLAPFDALLERFSFVTGLSSVGAFELNNGLFASSAGHPLMRYLCEHVGRPWPAWGGADVDQREAVAWQLQQSGFVADAALTPASSKNHFLATTGPGFFTRAVMRGLSLDDAELKELGQAASLLICPSRVFYPLPNTDRSLPYEGRAALLAETRGAGRPPWPWHVEGRAPLAVHHWCRTWDPEPDLGAAAVASTFS